MLTAIAAVLHRFYGYFAWCFKGKNKDNAGGSEKSNQRKEAIDPVTIQVELEEQGQNHENKVPYNEVPDEPDMESAKKKANNTKLEVDVIQIIQI